MISNKSLTRAGTRPIRQGTDARIRERIQPTVSCLLPQVLPHDMPDLAILQTRLQNLKWSHILATLRVEDETARRWYLETASAQTWNVRTLNRNISTQYYERHYVQPSLPSESTPVPQKEASPSSLGSSTSARMQRTISSTLYSITWC